MNVTLLQLGASYMNKHGEITQFPLLCWVWLDRKRYTSQCSQAKLEESNNQRAEARGFLFPMYTSLGWLYHLVAAELCERGWPNSRPRSSLGERARRRLDLPTPATSTCAATRSRLASERSLCSCRSPPRPPSVPGQSCSIFLPLLADVQW
jgi:hypothetical protein